MQVTERSAGDVIVLDAAGRMTRNDGSGVLKKHVTDILEQGQRHLLINLTGIDYLDSTCVGEMVSTFITVRNSGGALKLFGTNPRIQALLSITKLDTVFENHDTESAALAAFAPS
jgi:anti-sigma B factor antagonist